VHHGVTHVAENALVAPLVHVGAMMITCAAVALLAYEVVGLGVLRRLWFNLDLVWTFALVTAGAAVLLTA
jgi:hypothetical protein